MRKKHKTIAKENDITIWNEIVEKCNSTIESINKGYITIADTNANSQQQEKLECTYVLLEINRKVNKLLRLLK